MISQPDAVTDALLTALKSVTRGPTFSRYGRRGPRTAAATGDGRGIAAALTLGAQGVGLGTRCPSSASQRD
jgi:hypothetical protein